MRTLEEIKSNSQVQIEEKIISKKDNWHGLMGYLRLRDSRKTMTFVLSIDKQNGMEYEHVSVSYYGELKKTPSWEEMCAVKDVFWNAEDAVHQIHPKESQYVHGVNSKKNILHLWRPVGGWGKFEE